MLGSGTVLTRSICLFAFAAALASAGQGQSTAAPAREPDVAILATVNAKELRFTAVGDVNVTFPGQSDNATIFNCSKRPRA